MVVCSFFYMLLARSAVLPFCHVFDTPTPTVRPNARSFMFSRFFFVFNYFFYIYLPRHRRTTTARYPIRSPVQIFYFPFSYGFDQTKIKRRSTTMNRAHRVVVQAAAVVASYWDQKVRQRRRRLTINGVKTKVINLYYKWVMTSFKQISNTL